MVQISKKSFNSKSKYDTTGDRASMIGLTIKGIPRTGKFDVCLFAI